MQVEAGLSDLRQAYAELHEQLDGKQVERPPEEQQQIRQQVSQQLTLCYRQPLQDTCPASHVPQCFQRHFRSIVQRQRLGSTDAVRVWAEGDAPAAAEPSQAGCGELGAGGRSHGKAGGDRAPWEG